MNARADERLGPLSRLHVVAHELGASSPAQPRLASLLRFLVQRGADVTLWIERDPGPWAAQIVGAGRLTVRVVADPVHRGYRWLGSLSGGKGAPPAAAPTSAPTAAKPPSLLHRLWRLGSRVQSALLFPDPQRFWAARVQRRLLATMRPGDVVLTCSRPESALLVGAAAQRRGARWWADFADGWCFQGLRPNAMTDGPRRDRELALERSLVGSADLVSTVNDELGDYFASLRNGRHIAVYPNIVPDELAALPATARARGDALPTIGYFGRLSLSDGERSLLPLLALLRADAVAADRRRARFEFLGEFAPRDRAEIDEVQRLGHEVVVAPPLSRERLAARRADFDGALVLGSPHQRGTSSKLLDTLGLGLPVVAFVPVPSAAHALITATGCGEVMDLTEIPDCTRWRRFLSTVRGTAYRVDPRVRERYTSASVLPGFLATIGPWLETATPR